MAVFSDYQLQKHPGRQQLYARDGGLWWSAQLRRWMVSDPALVGQVLRNSAFTGHSYDVSAIMSRFGIDLAHLEALSGHFPLAFEGERHRALRRKFSAEIAVNTAVALAAFSLEVNRRCDRLLLAGNGFCAMRELLSPATLAAVIALSGLRIGASEGIAQLPLLFDDTISLNKRAQINATVDAILREIGDAMPDEEKYFRIAILALSANTLLGSLGQSLLQVLAANPGAALCAMAFDKDFPATGLPLIEKRAAKEVALGGRVIMAGDRLRLFLDAAGFAGGGMPAFSELYFAAGKHKCPGMNFSRRCWKLLAGRLSRSPLAMRLVQSRQRKGDNVFNFAEAIEVAVDG